LFQRTVDDFAFVAFQRGIERFTSRGRGGRVFLKRRDSTEKSGKSVGWIS